VNDRDMEPPKPPPPAQEPEAKESDLETSKREFIETFFRRGAEFAEELMHDNERLRYRVVQLEEQNRILTADEPGKGGTERKALRELVARIEELSSERDQLLTRFAGVAKSTADFQARFHDIERENNNLANLYVASYQLHSTMDLREVTQIILEILLNFIGAKTFAIQLIDEDARKLRTLAAEGMPREQAPQWTLDDVRVRRMLDSGQPVFDDTRFGQRADLEKPAILAPIRIAGKVVGAIVVWDLLSQKTGLDDVDYELLNLLGAHAAAALQAAKLTAELAGRPPQLWAATDLV
jgi:hypothetical protein